MDSSETDPLNSSSTDTAIVASSSPASSPTHDDSSFDTYISNLPPLSQEFSLNLKASPISDIDQMKHYGQFSDAGVSINDAEGSMKKIEDSEIIQNSYKKSGLGIEEIFGPDFDRVLRNEKAEVFTALYRTESDSPAMLAFKEHQNEYSSSQGTFNIHQDGFGLMPPSLHAPYALNTKPQPKAQIQQQQQLRPVFHSRVDGNPSLGISQSSGRGLHLNSPIESLSVWAASENDTRNVDLEEINNPIPPKKKKKTSNDDSGDGFNSCKCKKIHCLKLYCDCFSYGRYCTDACSCQDCYNSLDYEDSVLMTREQMLSRNAHAFDQRIIQYDLPIKNEDPKQLSPSLSRLKKGCKCKQSMCTKKYCECFQVNVGCSFECQCVGCQNVYGRKEDPNETQRTASNEVDVREDVFVSQHDLTPQTPLKSSNHGTAPTNYENVATRSSQELDPYNAGMMDCTPPLNPPPSLPSSMTRGCPNLSQIQPLSPAAPLTPCGETSKSLQQQSKVIGNNDTREYADVYENADSYQLQVNCSNAGIMKYTPPLNHPPSLSSSMERNCLNIVTPLIPSKSVQPRSNDIGFDGIEYESIYEKELGLDNPGCMSMKGLKNVFKSITPPLSPCIINSQSKPSSDANGNDISDDNNNNNDDTK